MDILYLQFFDDKNEEPEPNIDVCQNCGAYFDWDGVLRQAHIKEHGLVDGSGLQRCYKCIAHN